MNVRIPTDHITTGSFRVQWDQVTDTFPITYTVRWYGGDIDYNVTTDGLSYTVMGLTSTTSYIVTVVAINTCCGAGPVSSAVMSTTMSDEVEETSSIMPTPTPSNSGTGTYILTLLGNFHYIYHNDYHSSTSVVKVYY